MIKRFVLAASLLLVAPCVLLEGCSTSSVHPPTYGDCLTEGACGPVPPSGQSTGSAVGGGTDGGGTRDGQASDAGVRDAVATPDVGAGDADAGRD